MNAITALATSESTAMVLHEPSPQLAKLDQARQMLAECTTLSEVKKIRDIAEAARVYAKAAHLGRESQNYAAEIALLAACKAGEILKQLDRKPGQRTDKPAASVAGGSEYARTLTDTQTPERTARYWQKLAEVPEQTTAGYIEKIKADAVDPLRNKDPEDITASGLLRAAKKNEPPKPKENHLCRLFPEWLGAQLTGGVESDIYRLTFPRIRFEDVEKIAKAVRDAFERVATTNSR